MDIPVSFEASSKKWQIQSTSPPFSSPHPTSLGMFVDVLLCFSLALSTLYQKPLLAA